METEAAADNSIVDRLMSALPDDSLSTPEPEGAPAEDKTSLTIDNDPTVERKPEDKPAEAIEAKPTEDVEIEYEGNRYKLPPELKDAFLRQQDYTKKTMELAEQRKAIETGKANPQEIEQLTQKLTHYESLLGQQIVDDSKTDWVKLLREDPVGYLEKKQLAENRALEWQQLSAKKNEEYQTNIRQTLAQEAQHLIAKRPEWKDEAVWKADFEKLKPTLKAVGYSDQDINGVVDHRAIIIADKARKYDELMASKADVAKKIEKLPPKVERPGVGDGGDGQASKAAMSSLRKTGSVDDAAAAILSLMH